jgi:superfamily II DNA or RNA helicase
MPKKTKYTRAAAPKPKKTPRTRKPENMSLEEWQIALRREFGREQPFKLKNIGDAPVFSEFEVTNPATGGVYRLAIRGANPGDNFCSCPDFAVNTLGTCKHLEFALAKLARKPGGKKAFNEGFHPAYSEIYLRYGAQREVRFRAGANCPKPFAKYAALFFDEENRLRPEAAEWFHTFLKEAPMDGHEVRCYEDAIQFIAQLRDNAHRRKAILEAFPKGAASAALEKLVHAKLYPYQRRGALFAAEAGRCLIADDMGLGKTIQAITAAEILAKTAGVERVLVVAPTALKHQWKREVARFVPHRSAEVVEGLIAKRRAAYRADTFYKVTNYDVVHLDWEAIAAWKPDLIILDEAQRIKNWKTRRAQCVKRLDSTYAIVLTGTPLENRLEELHSIVEFVDRFHLGPLFRFLHEHQHLDENGRVIGYRNLSNVAETLQPILLRRTKDEVLKELPERTDKHFFLEMTDEQWRHHNENQKTVAEIVQKWRRFGFLSEKDQRVLMIAMQNMRMACNSTYLLDKTTDYGVKAGEAAALLEELLEEPDTKVVVFSQWVGTHKLLIDRLQCGHAFYHGSLDTKDREEAIRRFRDDPACRVFLSTDSGGVGLNLQHASVVINMDQPWNPAVLEQRIGRVHRLGQQRPVRVYHLVSQGTIEHGMLDVLAFKKSVFAGVLDGGANEVFLGGTKLKKFMETVDKVTASIPDPMPKQEQPEPAAEAAADAVKEVEDIAIAPIGDATSAEVPTIPAAEPWQDLVNAGISLFTSFTRAMSAASPEGGSSTLSFQPEKLAALVARDEQTNTPYLKLPMPNPNAMRDIAQAVGALAAAIQKGMGSSAKMP